VRIGLDLVVGEGSLRKLEPYPGVELARGLNEMAAAIVEGRPHRASGEQAAHVVEIICAVGESWSNGGEWVPVASTFPPLAPPYT
jgi:predicted dehydrogenase